MKNLSIVVLAMPNAMALDMVGPSDVFHNANRVKQLDKLTQAVGYDVSLVSVTRDLQVKTSSGLVISCEKSIFDIDTEIDTLIVGGFSMDYDWNSQPELVQWLEDNHGRIRRIAAVCLGAFLLAKAGLLFKKNATTHWMKIDRLERDFQGILVKSGPIYIKDKNIYTSAGASAGIDLSLALVEEDNGRDLAIKVAKELVLYLKRTGSQSQFSAILLDQEAVKQPIYELQQWIRDNLSKDLNNLVLSEKAFMSPRNFARVFHAEIGSTPAKYVEKIRVESARRYLEYSNEPLERIAAQCGFSSADAMRKIFLRILKITPYDYRKRFGQL
jgi:transcriptional regulator GlxA family with amidase domain